MPTLDWLGKERIITHHLEVPFHVLDHQYGFNVDGKKENATGSGNKIIHGDNLIALKSLLPQYEGRVDCVYIDPPYNTGNEGWVYNDNVNDPRILKWIGETVGKEGEDFSRHDKWLCMMYPRLVMLEKLLSPEGAIFISIDRNEFASLKAICDRIFNNFVGCISWQRTYSPRNDSKGIVSETEYILVYSKSSDWQPNRLERTDEMDAKYKNPDNDWGLWRSDNAYAPGGSSHQGMVYGIQHPFTGEILYPSKSSHWRYDQQTLFQIMNGWCPYELRDIKDAKQRAEVCGIPESEVREGVCAIMLKDSLEKSRELAKIVMERGQWPKYYFTKMGAGGIARKSYLAQMEGRVVTNFWGHSEVGNTDEAKKELKDIFGGKVPFDTPKPVRLIERILHIATRPDSIVLDSFAGSGTTAHAVLRQNRKDGGNRRFILIEMMDYAEDVTAERVRRVITGYPTKLKNEVEIFSKKLTPKNLTKGAKIIAEAEKAIADNHGKYPEISKLKISDNCVKVIASTVSNGIAEGIPATFDYYEVGAPLFIDDNTLNEEVGEEKIREYVYYSETHRPLSRKSGSWLMDTYNDIGYYFYYKPEVATDLNMETVQEIVIEKAEQYVIYADTCTLPQEFMEAKNITFKKIPRDIRKF